MSWRERDETRDVLCRSLSSSFADALLAGDQGLDVRQTGRKRGR